MFLCCVLIQGLCILPELSKPSEFLVSKIVRRSLFLSDLDKKKKKKKKKRKKRRRKEKKKKEEEDEEMMMMMMMMIMMS